MSSDEQVEGLSLKLQEDKIREWCERHGYEMIEVFRDEGESAFTDDASKRRGFSSLLHRLDQLMPSVIVVFSLDSWARSLGVASDSFRLMAELGVGFVSVTET